MDGCEIIITSPSDGWIIMTTSEYIPMRSWVKYYFKIYVLLNEVMNS